MGEEFVVYYRSKFGGDRLWCGGSGICVNTGVRHKYSSVVQRKNAVRFTLAQAKRRARDHNDQWTGHYEPA